MSSAAVVTAALRFKRLQIHEVNLKEKHQQQSNGVGLICIERVQYKSFSLVINGILTDHLKEAKS